MVADVSLIFGLKLTIFRKRNIRQKQIKIIIIGDGNKVGNHTASFYKQEIPWDQKH